MAPKSSASSAGGGGGKAVKKDNPGGTKEKHKPKFVRWKGCPPAVCKSCEQSTDQLDRDCPEGQEDFLYWVQCRTSSKINKSKPYPSGEECYPCYFIRRKIFNAIKATKLAEKRKQKPSCDARFWKQRRRHVRGEPLASDSESDDLDDAEVGICAPRNVTSQAKTSEVDRSFERRFITGSFEPIEEFAEKRRIEYESIENLTAYIISKYPSYRVRRNADKVLGVEILDQTGNSYRFERGAEESANLSREEEYKHDSDAEEAHQVAAALKEDAVVSSSLHEPTPAAEGTHETDVGHEMISEDAADTESVAQKSNKSAHSANTSDVPRRSPRSSFSSGGSAAFVNRSRRMKSTTAARRGSPSCRSTASTTVPDDDGDEEVDEPPEDPGDLEAKRSLCDRFIQDANKTITKIMKSFGNDAHFDNSKQKATCTASVNRLRTWGRKCGKYPNEESQKTSLMCFNMADEIEERQSAFEAARTEFDKLVNETLSPERSMVLKDLPDSFFANMIVQGCTRITDAALTSAEHANALVHSLVFTEPPGTDIKGVSLMMLSNKTGSEKLVKTTQRSALLAYLEKVLKQSDRAKLVASCLAASRPAVGNLSLEDIQKTVDDVPEAGDATMDAYFVQGWCPSLWLDLVSVFTMGQIGMTMIGNSSPSVPLLQLTKKVIDNQSKLDARVRCYHKMMTGVSNSAAKDVWAKMTELNNTTVEVDKYEFSANRDSIRLKIKNFGEALALENVCEVADVLGDACLTPEAAELKHFGQWVSTLNETAETQEARELAKELTHAFESLLAKFLEDPSYHLPVLEGTIVPQKPIRGDSGAEVVSFDDMYFADYDNLPDEVAMLHITQAACTMLKSFPTGGNDQLLQEASERAEVHLKLWKAANLDYGSDFHPADRLKRYAELNRSSIWAADRSNQQRLKDPTQPCFHVQTFVDKSVDCNRVAALTVRLLEQALYDGGPESVAFSREAHALQCSLPRETHELITVHKEIIAVEEHAVRVAAGKSNMPSIPNVNDVLHDLAHAKRLFPKAGLILRPPEKPIARGA